MLLWVNLKSLNNEGQISCPYYQWEQFLLTPSWQILCLCCKSRILIIFRSLLLLDCIFWLHKMWLRGTLDICAWPASQRWLSKQKWQVNCWFLFRKKRGPPTPEYSERWHTHSLSFTLSAALTHISQSRYAASVRRLSLKSKSKCVGAHVRIMSLSLCPGVPPGILGPMKRNFTGPFTVCCST